MGWDTGPGGRPWTGSGRLVSGAFGGRMRAWAFTFRPRERGQGRDRDAAGWVWPQAPRPEAPGQVRDGRARVQR